MNPARAEQRRRLGRSRGAALVEAALILPIVALLLGLTTYEYRSYRERMKAQNTTRLNALFFASHGCQGSSDAGGGLFGSISSQSSYGAMPNQLDPSGSQAVTDKNPPGGAGNTLSTASTSNKAESSATGYATGGHLARQVKGKSSVYCNERPQDGDPIGVVKWGFSFFKSGFL